MADPDLSHVPITDYGAAEYILQGGDRPFEKLARMWEVESKKLNIRGQTPPEIFARRMEDFRKVWRKVIGGTFDPFTREGEGDSGNV